ncbi:uncharacterized protein [Solanum tuberosum]|uniref:non-specific serine/threonine protein kinase n=2 Tax=Solanum tuberosum TaxID=4113 RepID=M1AIJ2_SOLTU|nr:PREDICTED: uncharacterized protein LOC102581761 [Solanum tuberosum]KAH0704499.1 hypothetical protein KY285_018777 [Solanum tuberosum]
MSITYSFFAGVFLLVSFITSSIAQTSMSQCVPSSCGEIRDIKFPFRLRTDPEHCGKHEYELDCQNNQTFYTYKSRKFYVQEINYTSYMIRLLDPGLKDQNENCSVFPDYRANYGGITSEIFQLIHINNSINYVNCRTPINSSQYIPTTFCRTNTTSPNANFSYLVLKEIWQASDLENGCKVETVAWSSAPGIFTNKSPSLASTHQALAYGFEVSWKYGLLCRECEASDGSCYLEDNSDVVTCIHYCKEDIPVSERSFGCKIEYYSVFVLAYGAIAIDALIVLRYIVGIAILIAVVVWQCKRRNLNTSNDDILGNKASSSEQNC